MNTWDKLSMKEKHTFIRTAIKNGLSNLDEIRESYNSFADGGFKPDSATINNPIYNANAVNPIYDYMRDKGLTAIQAAALMGNLAVESYLNADLKQIGGPAYGLMQAEASRQKAMRSYNAVPYQFGSNFTQVPLLRYFSTGQHYILIIFIVGILGFEPRPQESKSCLLTITNHIPM